MDIQRDKQGNLAAFKAEHGGDASLKGGRESVRTEGGQLIREGTVDPSNINKIKKDATDAGFTNVAKAVQPNEHYEQRFGFDSHGKSTGLNYMQVGKVGEAKKEDMETQLTGRDKQAMDVDKRITDVGSTGQYHLGSDNIRGGGFKVGGMNFVAAEVSRKGDEYTISGTNNQGFHVDMKGRSKGGIDMDEKGKFKGISDFEVTDLQNIKRDDTLVSKTYTDRDKLTIDQQDDITMSNLNKLRTHYNESPEEFVKNHPDIIMAYGVGKNVLENFKEIGGVIGSGNKVKSIAGGGSSPKTPPKVQYPRIEEAKGPYSHWYPGIMD